MKTGLIFDLDGTLLDTLQDLCDSTNHALRAFGYPQRTLEEVRRSVGNGAGKLIERVVPPGADPAPVLAAFQAHYPTHCQIHTAPYPGIREALEALGRTYPLAIVSNKPDEAVKALCGALFPGIYALGETPDCPRKPAPDMVRKALAAIGADRGVYIGDSEVDVETAKNAQMPCLSVLWGFRDREELEAAGARYYCKKGEDLPEAIGQILDSYGQ